MEAVKWLALVSMTIDHANRFFFKATLDPAYCFGRLAMPLFAFILAYNLAQPGVKLSGVYSKVLLRLIIFGFLATPGYIAMRHLEHLLPLNIMFMLAAAVAIFYHIDEGGAANRFAALFIFLIGGLLVEYDWVGIIFCLTCWFFCRKPSLLTAFAWFIAYLLLDKINGNHWALLSLLVIYLATKNEVKIPRIRYLFYIYYPLHLTLFYFLARIYRI